MFGEKIPSIKREMDKLDSQEKEEKLRQEARAAKEDGAPAETEGHPIDKEKSRGLKFSEHVEYDGLYSDRVKDIKHQVIEGELNGKIIRLEAVAEGFGNKLFREGKFSNVSGTLGGQPLTEQEAVELWNKCAPVATRDELGKEMAADRRERTRSDSIEKRIGAILKEDGYDISQIGNFRFQIYGSPFGLGQKAGLYKADEGSWKMTFHSQKNADEMAPLVDKLRHELGADIVTTVRDEEK
jgi:hypothetical protein